MESKYSHRCPNCGALILVELTAPGRVVVDHPAPLCLAAELIFRNLARKLETFRIN